MQAAAKHTHRRAYLDHAATAPMHARVREVMSQEFAEHGNPASIHRDGQRASDRLETAREVVAGALGADRAEVTLTSGGTESINLAMKGLFWARRAHGSGPLVLMPEGEHHATFEAAEWLEGETSPRIGAAPARVIRLPIDEMGVLRPETFEAAIAEHGAEQIAVATCLWANNEVGSVQPIAELAAIAREADIPLHVDAVAALGQVPVSLRGAGIAALSVSAHKIGGPVGVGALALSRAWNVEPLLHGGGQQRARSGTQHVAGARGFAAALDVALNPSDFAPRVAHVARMRALRDRALVGMLGADERAQQRGAAPGDPHKRIAANAHVTYAACDAEALVVALDQAGVSVSSGSACQAGVTERSHVLEAMGVAADEAPLRVTVGPETAEWEVDALLGAIPAAIAQARAAAQYA